MKKNSLMNSLFGILPTFFFDKPSGVSVVETRGDADGEGGQLTGVARYLQKLEPKVEVVDSSEHLTGVAKYLAQQQAVEQARAPVAEELVEDEETPTAADEIIESEPALSGVEKYLPVSTPANGTLYPNHRNYLSNY